jgi:hypothetical protein
MRPNLPGWVVGDSPISQSACFEQIRRPLVWQSQNQTVLRNLNQGAEESGGAVYEWLRNEVFQGTVSGVRLDKLDITFEKPMIAHVPVEQIAFDEKQVCLSGPERSLPIDATAVTTMFGAKAMVFKSSRPIPREQIMEMKRAAAKKGVRLIPKNAYTPALDDDGKPLRNEKKKRLFNSPDGELIPKKEVPSPRKRPVVEWELVLRKPIYLAYGTLPKKRWRRTSETALCEVFLVFDDVAPQVPSCPGFNLAGFGATRSKKPNHITLKIATGDDTLLREVPLDAEIMLAEENMILWLSTASVEEGARLRVESLWIDTGAPPPKITDFRKGGQGRKRQSRQGISHQEGVSSGHENRPSQRGGAGGTARAAPPPPGY